MKRKDCDNSIRGLAATRRRPRCVLYTLLVTASLSALPTSAVADDIRVWPTASVANETVRLRDLCDVSGLDVATRDRLSGLAISTSPAPGGSKVIHMDMIRSALRDAKANMATITIRGAVRCSVTRATGSSSTLDSSTRQGNRRTAKRMSARSHAGRREAVVVSSKTLRQAVLDYFDKELRRYGGKADVLFDRVSEQAMSLSGPTYRFDVRRRGKAVLGLVHVDVDVIPIGESTPAMEPVAIVAQVSLIRQVVSARRAINLGATISGGDVELIPVVFGRLKKIGLEDSAMVIGQRAKKFMTPGTVIELAMLEAVPLVKRGQLVNLVSVNGAIRIATTAVAMEDGLLGRVVKLRATDNKRVEYDAVVTGPGRAEIGDVSRRAGS